MSADIYTTDKFDLAKSYATTKMTEEYPAPVMELFDTLFKQRLEHISHYVNMLKDSK